MTNYGNMDSKTEEKGWEAALVGSSGTFSRDWFWKMSGALKQTPNYSIIITWGISSVKIIYIIKFCVFF